MCRFCGPPQSTDSKKLTNKFTLFFRPLFCLPLFTVSTT